MTTKPLNITLQELLKKADGKAISFRELVISLRGRGLAVFLILLSLPFCLPIQIPGTSTPFGVAMALMGLRLSLGKALWWPQWLLNKPISYKLLQKLTNLVDKWFKRVKRLLKPRMTWLAEKPLLHKIHGLFITLMALLLAIPFPIPLTNLLSAFPILFMGIGLLEDDGVAILISYFLGFISIGFWVSILIFGHAGYLKIISII